MPIDLRIDEIARHRHGVVHLDDLRALGLTASAVRSRVATGRLHRVHRGVFAVGASGLSRMGEWQAAVLAAGPGAALSHLSSAAHLGVRRDVATIDVSVPRRNGRRPGDFRTHRVRPFSPAELCVHRGIVCTSLPRTLIDIAPMVGGRGVELAIAEAQYRRLFDRRALIELVECSSGRAGCAIVRRVLEIEGVERTLTNQELEERCFALLRGSGLPVPLVNELVVVGDDTFKCDFVWRTQRVVVEADGHETHARSRQFEEDRRRDAILNLAGWVVLRFTWRQVTTQGEWVASVVRRTLESRR